MKKIVMLVGLLSVVTGGGAFAQPGINLAWNDCLGSGGGAIDRAVACTNSGAVQNNIYTSFIVPEDVPQCAAADGFMDVYVDAATLPSWWQDANRWSGNAGSSTCPGWYDAASGGLSAFGPSVTQTRPQRLRIRFVVAVTAGDEQYVTAGNEYLSHIIRLRFGPGTLNNPGCLTPACFVANEQLLLQPGTLPATRLQNPSTSNYVTWRGGGSIPCPLATPAKKATWGSIKAIYR